MAQMTPLESQQRILLLDYLRGFALLGVMLGNFSEFILDGITATQQQLQQLPTAKLDGLLEFFYQIFIQGKAYALFTLLFGIGFYLQTERLKAKSDQWQTLYKRRMISLLCFGWLHLLIFFPWDILHLYGLAGLLLLLLAKQSDRFLLRCGLILVICAEPLVAMISEQILSRVLLSGDGFFENSAIELRQGLTGIQGYSALMLHFAKMLVSQWLLNGDFIATLLATLGFFMLGLYAARMGLITALTSQTSKLNLFFATCLIIGISAELFSWLLALLNDAAIEGKVSLTASVAIGLEVLLNQLATPFIASAYICFIAAAIRSKRFKKYMSPIASIGQMALTNYVLSGLITMLVFFGFGLADQIGLSQAYAISLIAFIGMALFSHYWLKKFQYGPLEEFWRAWTYR